MSIDTVRVFVSSTWLDLKPERNAIELVLQRMQETKYIGMEYFGSREDTPENVAVSEVDRCQVYLGILGGRYGSGITEAEYRRSRELNLPCFIYLKAEEALEPQWQEADREKAIRLGKLKEKIRRAHVVSEFSSPNDLAARVTADLHRWLVETYFLPAAKEAARNDYPLDQLSALLADVARLSKLQEEMLKRSPIASLVTSQGERSVTLGQGNTGSIHTGDIIYQLFSESSPTLSQHIRVDQFRSLVHERTRDFVGRDFVFQTIDGYITGQTDKNFLSGYIVIRGEPGIGKTALIAQLVKRHGYVHHFNIASQNIRSARDFLGNVCAELIVRYKLEHLTLPLAATHDSGFLSQLLTKAATKVQEHPIVLLVDALDEAEHMGLASNANRLFLPPILPEGVFFVVTTREKEEYRFLVDHRKDIYLDDRSPNNLADVRLYIGNFIDQHREQIILRIAQWGVDEDEFVNVITDKSEGNFMYLVHVLRDVRDGHLTPSNVDSIYHLPIGLKEYYQRHWRMMREQDPQRFRDYYEPVVGMLATVREPVKVEQLVEWTGLNPLRIKEVIATWREFLNEDETSEGERLYRVYHNSFQDFLREEIGLTRFHRNIAQQALGRIKREG
jgi:hypothetical protein